MQPHMQQQIETQCTSWGQGCSPTLLSTPFHSGVIPLHSRSLHSHFTHPWQYHVVQCLLLVILGHSVIIGQLPWCCVPDYLLAWRVIASEWFSYNYTFSGIVYGNGFLRYNCTWEVQLHGNFLLGNLFWRPKPKLYTHTLIGGEGGIIFWSTSGS